MTIMTKVGMKKAGLGLALAATALASAVPADAQRYGGYRGWHGGYGGYGHRGGDVAGAAVLGGILGLGVGAVIASNNRDRYYDRGYRGGYGYYGQPQGYYYEGPRCFIQTRFDPYTGEPYRVRICN